jgi:hypothetical protein
MSGNSKVIMRLAVSESGISEPVFFKAGLTVNKEVYISKCLSVLHKCIQKPHKNEKIVFWPDLASAHYAKDTLVWLEELKIEYAPKEENPPNVPQIRPIKNLWAEEEHLSSKRCKVHDGKDQKELNSIETTGIHKAMKEAPAKARKAHRLEVTFFCK